MKIVIAALVVVFLSGCILRGPTRDDIKDFIKRNDVNPPTAALTSLQDVLKTELVPEVQGVKVIIIGNVMALMLLDEPTLNQHYDSFIKRLAAASEQPPYTREWYLSTSAGETPVKVSGIPGIYKLVIRAEVPKDIVQRICFSSLFGTIMIGSSGDLVVAQISSLGGPWVTHVLCSEKDNNYSTCEEQYQRGIYQGVDGREINAKYQVKEGGAVIDTATFKKRAP
ncbi:MAG TPA: hypothetical protein VN642_17120 [Dongiaceae bacterium]|nr:hypothetical protein [Dongiaceae bacterium]